ncbi:MAG: RDD family protein [Actinomycetota bacterium]|nr:RDD family protein [Actinomycetota bacterium]
MAFCANCGNELSDQAVACPNCGHPGPAATAAPRAYAPYSGAPVPFAAELASWGQRVGASLLDGLITGAVAVVLIVVTIVTAGSSDTDSEPPAAFWLALVVGIVLLPFLYRAVMDGGDRGQTVGKMALGIQVRDAESGTPIGFGRGLLRVFIATILWWLLYVPGIVDVLFPLWDPRRQTIHDKVARSVVIRRG